MDRRAPRRGLAAGLLAGLLTVAAMYVVAGLAGLQPLPELLQQPLLAVLPGPVFGFLIDTLQHAGKVLEEVGLIAALVAGFALLGAADGSLRPRFGSLATLGVAAFGWLAVVLVLLPVSGQGLLGLAGGLTQPLVWVLLLVVFGVALNTLQEALRAPGDRDVDLDRRRLLTWVPLGIGGASLVVLAARLAPGWVQTVFHPAEAGLAGFTPELTPAGHFYVVSKNFQDPSVAEQGWRLEVDGLVDNPLSLDYAALAAIAPASEYVTLECVSNDVGGALISTGRFTGVPLADMAAMAKPQGGAAAVNFSAADGYTESLPLSLVRASPEILVAYQLDGQPLPREHGFPARILIPGHYGMKGPKWLQRISLAASQHSGYWEEEGWDQQALVRTTSRIDSPQDGATVRAGPVTVGGVAFAGKRGISMVELSTDGGGSWRPADLQPPLSPFTWVLWRALWHPTQEGTATLQVRAADGTGRLQDSGSSPSFPSGAAGYHTVRVSVGR